MTQNLLAFDTSAAHCAAALFVDGNVTTRIDEMARGQAEHLMPMLEEVLRRAGISWGDLDGIGVCTGPGNFTGIRISVAAARGLALGLSKPAIGVSAFEAQVFGLALPVTACLPAPRDTYYSQTLTANGPSKPMQGERPDKSAAMLPAVVMIENIARIAVSRLGTKQPRPAPLYIRAADAAPPRDPAPVIVS